MVAPEPNGPSRGRSSDPVGPARWRALTALVALERGRTPRLREALRVDGLSSRDRALALELTLGVERRRITVDAVLQALATRGALPADPYVLSALRLGAYQVLFLPRVATHAAVATAVGLVRKQRSFVNAVLRRLVAMVVERPCDDRRVRAEMALPPREGQARTLAFTSDVLPDPESAPAEFLAVRCGVPAEFVARWRQHYGAARAEAIAAASMATPGVTLRVRAGVGVDALRRMLADEGVATTLTSDPRLLRLGDVADGSPFATRAYRDGAFSVQDPTALLAADAVAARPGETILDLCAAPGGKASALAEALAGSGAVFAHDADPARLALVAEACRRLRLEATLRVVADLAQAPAAVDAVLVDVPCSNTGVLARRVEVRRRRLAPALTALVRAQTDLLATAVGRTRPGGRVVYSTCSLEPEENRGVVDAVCATRSGVTVLRDQLTWPEAGDHDGGYFAVLGVGST